MVAGKQQNYTINQLNWRCDIFSLLAQCRESFVPHRKIPDPRSVIAEGRRIFQNSHDLQQF